MRALLKIVDYNFNIREFCPDGAPKFAVIILHGMMEHGGYYQEFGKFLSQNNGLAISFDLVGHGERVQNDSELGILNSSSWQVMLVDIRLVHEAITKKYPGLPVVVLGHSMGSFLAQFYVMVYGEECAGLALLSSAKPSPLLLRMGAVIAKIGSALIGWQKRANLLDFLTFFPYRMAFFPSRTRFDWLSRDGAFVDRYVADPKTGGTCSYGFYDALYNGLLMIHKPNSIKRIPMDLPMLFLSGSKDPLSNGGEEVAKLADLYRESGMSDVSEKNYEKARHVLLHEDCKEEVMGDILQWVYKL